jgi:hypothetical protein
MIFTFGQYEHETLDYVLCKDPQYLVFLMGQKWFHGSPMHTELVDRGFNLSPTVNFGKYKGWSISDIKYKDKPYFNWLKRM